jgi:hypothetical protein
VVDTIAKISEPLYVHGPESEVLPTLKAFHSWWTFFIDNVGSTDENLAVFQRTFVGGSWAPSYSEASSKRIKRSVSRSSSALYKDSFRI